MKPTIIIFALIFALLCAGCGASTAGAPETVSKITEQTAEQTSAAPVSAGTAVINTDYLSDEFNAAYRNYAPDAVVMTVNGQTVTWDDYFCWLYSGIQQLSEEFEISDWSAAFPEIEGLIDDDTYGGYVRYYAEVNSAQGAVIESKAAELDVSLSLHEKSKLDKDVDSYIDSLGGEAAFLEYLNSMNLTREQFIHQNELIVLLNCIFVSNFGEDGADLPDEDALAFAENEEYLYAKHILFKTQGDDGKPLDDAAVARQKAAAEADLAALRACTPEKLPELFDQLMNEHSEDPGVEYYPDGYYFLEGTMVPEFEAAAKAPGENGLSDLVESSYGYHILYCPAMDPDHIVDYDSNGAAMTLRSIAASTLFNNMVSEWNYNPEIVYAPEFEALDINALLKK